MTTRIRMTILVSGVLVAGALALGGCAQEPVEESAREVPRNVRVLELGQEAVQEYLELSGPVSPVRGTDLSAQESGPVVDLPVAKGAAVAAGDVVVVQDRTILAADSQAAAAAEAAEAYNVDKVRKLHEAGKVSRIELLNAESAFARAASAAAVAAERYHRAAVAAPFAGIVAERYVELGELVAPGQPVARIIDPYTLELEAYLTDQQVAWVQEGEMASVLLGGGETARGKVTWVGPEADRRTGKFPVEIEIPNPDLALRSGVIGRARLEKHVTSDVVAIPRDAVLEGGGAPAVFVVEGDRAARRELELGASQGLMVVVHSGLVAGELLVVRGQRELRQGSLVNITETATAADGSLAGDPDVVGRASAGSRIPAAGETTEAGR